MQVLNGLSITGRKWAITESEIKEKALKAMAHRGSAETADVIQIVALAVVEAQALKLNSLSKKRVNAYINKAINKAIYKGYQAHLRLETLASDYIESLE